MDVRRDLATRVKLAAHGRGLIVKEFPRAVLRLAGNKSQQELNTMVAQGGNAARRARVALEFQRLTSRVLGANGPVCATGASGLSADFVRLCVGLPSTDGERNLGLRTDSKTVFAFEAVNGGDGGLEYALRGVASYGASDGLDTENKKITIPRQRRLQHALHDGQLVELDLLCSRSDRRRLGKLLLCYVLSQASKRKRHGQYLFHGAVVRLAAEPGPANPMHHILLNLGFVQRDTKVGGELTDQYMYLTGPNESTWVTRVRDRLPEPPPACSTPGTSRCI